MALDEAGRLRLTKKIATAPGARTSLFVPEMGRLFLAVPHRGAQAAEVRIFAVRPEQTVRGRPPAGLDAGQGDDAW